MEDLDKTFLKRLAEVGLLATLHEDLAQQASLIFSALEKVRPQQAATLIGCATVAMNNGHFDKAIQYLSEAKPSNAEDVDKVNIFLALAYQGAGREHERDALLNKIAAQGEPEAKQLAKDLLKQEAVKA